MFVPPHVSNAQVLHEAKEVYKLPQLVWKDLEYLEELHHVKVSGRFYCDVFCLCLISSLNFFCFFNIFFIIYVFSSCFLSFFLAVAPSFFLFCQFFSLFFIILNAFFFFLQDLKHPDAIRYSGLKHVTLDPSKHKTVVLPHGERMPTTCVHDIQDDSVAATYFQTKFKTDLSAVGKYFLNRNLKWNAIPGAASTTQIIPFV
jgi:hypothetical protein